MSKFRKNQDGVGLAEVVIIILIILVLGFIGWYGWKAYENRGNSDNSQPAPQNTQQGNTTTTTSDAPNGTVIKIKSLGLEITVKDSLKDITFVSKNGALANKTKYSSVNISSATLISLDSKCKATSSSAPLGTIYKTAGTYPANADNKNSTGQLIKQFDKYYVAYAGPKDFCSPKKNAQDEETLLKNDLNTSLSSVMPVKL